MKAALLGLIYCSTMLSAEAEIVTKSVVYQQGGTQLQGFLAYDDAMTGNGKLPGVVLMHEWWGLNDFMRGRATALAKLGYVAFAADLYGQGQSTTSPQKAKELASQLYGKPLLVERARAGLDQLIKTGLADDSKLAAIGFCFGGAACQVLAYSGAPLRGIASFHGALVPAPTGVDGQGKPKFLIMEGALDPNLEKDAVDAYLKSLKDGKFDFQYLIYSGALHAFMNPDADKAAAAGLPGVGYNPQVAQRAWDQMQSFFKEIFGVTPNA
jgi:dienelactone hydrolase